MARTISSVYVGRLYAESENVFSESSCNPIEKTTGNTLCMHGAF